jgi:tRNA dimethylallyltransferase
VTVPDPRSTPGPPPVVAVIGPTAVGKSDAAVALARRIGGEVVNADSMQLYRGMDIGTAKLHEDEWQGVPHHVLDVWDVTAEASVADYQRRARASIADIRARGAVPLLVGGSGLYVSAVLDDLRFPGTDAAVRARWEAALESDGPERLHALLAERDPDAAEVILPTNGRRLVRALEVVELTGSFTASMPLPGPDGNPVPGVDGPIVRVGLELPRDVLDARVETRVDRMWAAGLVDEVRALERVGLRRGTTAARAIGYAQVLRLLDGELDEASARDDTVARTRRFVRRQESWFRRDSRIGWLPADDPGLAERVITAVSEQR